MKIRIDIYNKDSKKFDYVFENFNWTKIKNVDFLEEVEINAYLYWKQIKNYYKRNKLRYREYLYNDFYEMQLDGIISKAMEDNKYAILQN